MGCDIHVCLEVNLDSGWTFLRYYSGGSYNASVRSYDFFSRLAGVRNNPNRPYPERELRFLPSNASDGTVFYYDQWEDDAHHVSHDTAEDFIKYKDEEDFYGLFEIDLDCLPDFSIDDFRIVYWFDN